MGYNITYTDKDLLISNINGPQIYIEVINTSKNYGAYRWTIDEGFSQSFSNKPNQINLGLPQGKNSFYYFDRVHITDKKTFFDIYVIKEDKELIKLSPSNHDINSPLIILTGHSGGGTSIISKSLCYLGAHIGDDYGNFSNRKAFESISFRTYLLHVFSSCEPQYFNKCLNSTFGSYNYKDNLPNIIKITDLENKNISLKLSQVFPNIKFLSVIKTKSNQTHSPEGQRFNETQNFDIYKQQHPTVEGCPMFHLDWNEYFTNYMYTNKVLKYVGLDIVLDKLSFNQMLKAIEFDNSRLV